MGSNFDTEWAAAGSPVISGFFGVAAEYRATPGAASHTDCTAVVAEDDIAHALDSMTGQIDMRTAKIKFKVSEVTTAVKGGTVTIGNDVWDIIADPVQLSGVDWSCDCRISAIDRQRGGK